MGEDQHRCLQRRPEQHLDHGPASRWGLRALPPPFASLPRPLQQGGLLVRNCPLLVGLHQAASGKGQEVGQASQVSLQQAQQQRQARGAEGHDRVSQVEGNGESDEHTSELLRVEASGTMSGANHRFLSKVKRRFSYSVNLQ